MATAAAMLGLRRVASPTSQRLAGNLRASILPRRFPPPLSFLLHTHATSFGFKEVHEEEKSKLVGNVFTKVASNYDLMNDLMSGGLHRLWKDRLVCKLHPFPGMKHLDVAGGTGDVAFRILDNINSVSHRALHDSVHEGVGDTHIYVLDINPNMLNVGKKRAIVRGLGEDHSLHFVQGDAEALSFGDSSMDSYTIAFGIRNVTHIEKVLEEAYRVLKRGGRFLCLELSHVDVPFFKQIYDYYSFSIIPAIGEVVAGDKESYQYLVESIRRFPSQREILGLSFCVPVAPDLTEEKKRAKEKQRSKARGGKSKPAASLSRAATAGRAKRGGRRSCRLLLTQPSPQAASLAAAVEKGEGGDTGFYCRRWLPLPQPPPGGVVEYCWKSVCKALQINDSIHNIAIDLLWWS